MSSFPHTRLFVGPEATLVVSGPHIQVIESQAGEVVYSTAQFEGSAKDVLLKSGPIRCADIDRAFENFVSSGEDKILRVWRVKGLQLLSERELPKKPTDVHLTQDGQTILVSDKFGDIFSYPLHYEPPATTSQHQPSTTEPQADPKSQIVSHENPSNGTLILGHTSLLTSFLLTHDEKYIVSADRDEHVRVSWYPQGYVIERYCLGHRKFVCTVHIPSFAPSVLVSGGGDPVLKFWDWMSGELLLNLPVADIVEPLVTVRTPKGKSTVDGEGRGKRRARRARGKGKSASHADESDEEEELGDVGAPEDVDIAMKPVEGEEDTAPLEADKYEPPASEDILVLVIHKIASVTAPDAGQFLVFSAIGATAIFYCIFPADFKSHGIPSVHSLHLQKPVIDFVVDDPKTGRVWVLLDGERGEDAPERQDLVKLLRWTDGKLVEDHESSPLLQALNKSCRIPADIEALDLYAALSSMPKHVDPEHDPFEGHAALPEQQTLGKRKAKEPTLREQARQRKKQAVLAKLQEQGQISRETSAPATVENDSNMPTSSREM